MGHSEWKVTAELGQWVFSTVRLSRCFGDSWLWRIIDLLLHPLSSCSGKSQPPYLIHLQWSHIQELLLLVYFSLLLSFLWWGCLEVLIPCTSPCFFIVEDTDTVTVRLVVGFGTECVLHWHGDDMILYSGDHIPSWYNISLGSGSEELLVR